MKKILHISVRADIGGGPQHVYVLLNNFNDDNFLNYVACPKQEPYWERFNSILPAGNVISIPYRKFSVLTLLRLMVFCFYNNMDIIHSHGKGAGVYGRFIRLFLKVKHVHTPHGIHLPVPLSLKDKFYLLYEKSTSFLTDVVIFVSESERDKAVSYKIYRNKVHSVVINNGVSLGCCDKDVDINKANYRLELGLSTDQFIFVSMSRFDKVKNSSLVIDIAKKCSHIIFIIYGDGPEHELIKQRVVETQVNNVLLPGVILEPYRVLPLCDAYLSTSLMEGLPLSLLEAMSCKLPIVASHVTGNVDCVKQGVNGYLYPVLDPDCAARFCEKLKNERETYIQMSSQAFLEYKRNFSAEQMVKKVQEIYLSTKSGVNV